MMSIVLPKTISFPYPFCIENLTFHLWSIFFAQLLKSLWCSMQFQCKCSSHLYRLNCRCSLQLYQTFCTPFSSWIQFCRVFSLSFFHYCTEKRSHRKDFLFYCRVYKSMLMHWKKIKRKRSREEGQFSFSSFAFFLIITKPTLGIKM